MAVHDAVRMLGHDNPVSLLDPDGLYDRAVYTDMVVNQFNELKIFNESDDDDTTGPIIFDLQHDEDLRLGVRSEEHTSELQSLMRISYAVFCLKKKNQQKEST